MRRPAQTGPTPAGPALPGSVLAGQAEDGTVHIDPVRIGPVPIGPVQIGLNAVIVTMINKVPHLLVVEPNIAICADMPESATTWQGADEAASQVLRPGLLPFGPFDPHRHRTFEAGLRAFVREQTGLHIGYAEQLYTFGDRGRQDTHCGPPSDVPHVVSVGYVALKGSQAGDAGDSVNIAGAHWRPWYDFFPWEDWRAGRPALLDTVILPELQCWAEKAARDTRRPQKFAPQQRMCMTFGLAEWPWDEERALDRYELLFEAGLVPEALRAGRELARKRRMMPDLGRPLQHDHRRIVSTAISRLRAKLKYRPVILELVDETFTLTELQETVEALLGQPVHKQNFRRLIFNARLVVSTGQKRRQSLGRPATLYRFHPQIAAQRLMGGIRLGGGR